MIMVGGLLLSRLVHDCFLNLPMAKACVASGVVLMITWLPTTSTMPTIQSCQMHP